MSLSNTKSSLSLLSNVWENFAKENLYIGLCLPNRYFFPIAQQQALDAMNRNSYYMHFDVERMWVSRNNEKKNYSFTWISKSPWFWLITFRCFAPQTTDLFYDTPHAFKCKQRTVIQFGNKLICKHTQKNRIEIFILCTERAFLVCKHKTVTAAELVQGETQREKKNLEQIKTIKIQILGNENAVLYYFFKRRNMSHVRMMNASAFNSLDFAPKHHTHNTYSTHN